MKRLPPDMHRQWVEYHGYKLAMVDTALKKTRNWHLIKFLGIVAIWACASALQQVGPVIFFAVTIIAIAAAYMSCPDKTLRFIRSEYAKASDWLYDNYLIDRTTPRMGETWRLYAFRGYPTRRLVNAAAREYTLLHHDTDKRDARHTLLSQIYHFLLCELGHTIWTLRVEQNISKKPSRSTNRFIEQAMHNLERNFHFAQMFRLNPFWQTGQESLGLNFYFAAEFNGPQGLLPKLPWPEPANSVTSADLIASAKC